MKVMSITAIELMGKCPEHAVTIWQDIVHMVVLAHQEALNISTSVSTDGGVDVSKGCGHCDTWWEDKVGCCHCLYMFGKFASYTGLLEVCET